MHVYREWLPVPDEPWKTYPIGTLPTLYKTESRLLARTRQADINSAFHAANPDAALAAFRDGAWRDRSATMLWSAQESWLAHMLRISAPTSSWQMVATGSLSLSAIHPYTIRVDGIWMYNGESLRTQAQG